MCSNDVRALLFDLNHIIGRVLAFLFLGERELPTPKKNEFHRVEKSQCVCELCKL